MNCIVNHSEQIVQSWVELQLQTYNGITFPELKFRDVCLCNYHLIQHVVFESGSPDGVCYFYPIWLA